MKRPPQLVHYQKKPFRTFDYYSYSKALEKYIDHLESRLTISDEEIEKEAYIQGIHYGEKYEDGFTDGAKWVLSKLKDVQ